MSASHSIGRSLRLSSLTLLRGASKLLPEGKLRDGLQEKARRQSLSSRGIPTKLSQILSLRNPKEAAALTAMEALPVEEILEVIQEDAPKLLKAMDIISEVGLPASMGQVHRVEMGGREYALKLQYPKALQDLLFDQVWMDRIADTFATFKRGFSLDSYRKEIKESLLLELDYQQEAQSLSTFHEHFKNTPGLLIPAAHSGHSGSRHLLMDWLPSESFDPQQLEHQQKLTITKALESLLVGSIFELGRVHSDPNPGNFGFSVSRGKASLVVHDFGATCEISPQSRRSILEILSMVERGSGDPLPALVEAGFDASALEPIRSNLLAFLAVQVEPFLSEGRMKLSEWNRSQRSADILGDHRFQFMIAAPPAWLGFMRALQGFFHYAQLLGVGVFLRPHLLPHLRSFTPPPREEKPIPLARRLIIHVREDERDKVRLTLTADAVENLADLMEDDLLQQLNAQKIDLDQIIKEVRVNGYRPMDLFTSRQGTKVVKVTLE